MVTCTSSYKDGESTADTGIEKQKQSESMIPRSPILKTKKWQKNPKHKINFSIQAMVFAIKQICHRQIL